MTVPSVRPQKISESLCGSWQSRRRYPSGSALLRAESAPLHERLGLCAWARVPALLKLIVCTVSQTADAVSPSRTLGP